MISKNDRAKTRKLREEGLSITQISKAMGVSRPTVNKILRKNEHTKEEQEPNRRNPKNNLLDSPSKGLVRKQETLEHRKRDISIERLDFELEDIKEARTLREKRKLAEREIEIERIRERRQREKEEQLRRAQQELDQRKTIEEEARRRHFQREKEIWLRNNTDLATSHLKHLIPPGFSDLLNMKEAIILKESIRAKLLPLFNKENEQVIKGYREEITYDFYKERIEPVINAQNRQKERARHKSSLLIGGRFKVLELVRNEGLSTFEKFQLQNYVEEGLKEELTGMENDKQLERIVDEIIDQWFEM